MPPLSCDELHDRERLLGAPLARVGDDPRLGWGLLIQVDDGVLMWSIPWSVEHRLRATHQRLNEQGPTASFDVWMLTVPGAVPTVHKDLFVETVDGGGIVIDLVLRPSGFSRETLDAYLQACQDQALQRLDEDVTPWAVPLYLTERERPVRRYARTLFVDEALAERLVQHTRTFAEQQVLRQVLDESRGPTDRPECPDNASSRRARL